MPDLPIYAIIGRGYAAAVNYETLRLTANPRLNEGLKVVFFGRPDPWRSFVDHEMGQCTTLMNVPGFHDQSTGNDWCSSEAFAARTLKQFDKIRAEREVEEKDLMLEHCRKAPDGKFALTMSDPATGTTSEVVAKYVDVCTGPGSARKVWEAPGDQPLLNQLFADGLLTQATDFLAKNFPEASIKDKVVGICGGGAVGAVCCELALDRGAKRVIWVSIDGFEGAFLPSRRFENLGRWAGEIKELDSRIRLYTYSSIAMPTRLPDKMLRMSISALAGKDAVAICDGDGPELEDRKRTCDSRGENEACDVLILAAGFPLNQVDEPYREVIGAGWNVIGGKTPGLESIPVGLRDRSGRVRVLGAAAIAHDLLANGAAILLDWVESLSVQLKVPGIRLPPAVAISARLISEANGYFPHFASSRIGPNWNSAFRANIEQCLPSSFHNSRVDQIEEWLSNRPTADVLHRVPDFAIDSDGNIHGDVLYPVP